MTSKCHAPPDPTEQRQELLESAVREGYFRVPREIPLSDLAAMHGLSDHEAMAQLNRGIEGLVCDAVDEE